MQKEEQRKNSELGKMLWTNLIKAWAHQNGLEVKSITFQKEDK